MAEGAFLHLQLVDSVVDNFGHFYPELVAKRDMISEIIRQTLQPSHLIALTVLLVLPAAHPCYLCLASLQIRQLGLSRRAEIEHACRDEEVSFSRTLQKGLERFNKAKAAASGSVFSGQDAFELYDTFGFPPDLTQVWCC